MESELKKKLNERLGGDMVAICNHVSIEYEVDLDFVKGAYTLAMYVMMSLTNGKVGPNQKLIGVKCLVDGVLLMGKGRYNEAKLESMVEELAGLAIDRTVIIRDMAVEGMANVKSRPS